MGAWAPPERAAAGESGTRSRGHLLVTNGVERERAGDVRNPPAVGEAFGVREAALGDVPSPPVTPAQVVGEAAAEAAACGRRPARPGSGRCGRRHPAIPVA